jgi:hypothetical protein
MSNTNSFPFFKNAERPRSCAIKDPDPVSFHIFIIQLKCSSAERCGITVCRTYISKKQRPEGFKTCHGLPVRLCTSEASEAMDSHYPMRSRAILTHAQARDIFLLKADIEFANVHAASLRIAKQYNVGAKAIRDIWIGRSWLEATFDLWEAKERPPRKIIGRPKGRKDSRPRQMKTAKKLMAGAGICTDSFQHPFQPNGAYACSTQCIQAQNYSPNIMPDLSGEMFSTSYSSMMSSLTTALPLPPMHPIMQPEFSSMYFPFSHLSPDHYSDDVWVRMIMAHSAQFRLNPSMCPQQLGHPPIAANPFTAAGQPWPATPLRIAQLLRAQQAADCARHPQRPHATSTLSAISDLYAAQPYHALLLAHLTQVAGGQRAASTPL